MKKVMCFAILSIALTNCQKKQALNADVPSSSQTSSSTATVNHSNARGIPTQYRQFSRVAGSYSCSGKDGNCLPDVIVKPKTADFMVLTNLINTVSTGNQQAIRQFFETNQGVLSHYIPAEEVHLVMTGDDIVTNTVNNDGVSNYLLFTNKETVMLVLPLIQQL